MTTHFSQSTPLALDIAVANSSLNGLTANSYALGAAINNTPTDGTTISYDLCDLTINLSSAIVTNSNNSLNNPGIIVWVLPSVDTVNYPNPPGGTAGLAPLYFSSTFPVINGASTSCIVCPNIPIPPYNFKIQIQNLLGLPLPATNNNQCQIQRKTVANW